MRKLILTIGIILSAVIYGNSQDRAEAETTKAVKHLSTVCGLSPTQADNVKPIVANYIKAKAANKLRYGSDTKGLYRANKLAKADYMERLGNVLSSDQLEKLKPKSTRHRISTGKITHRSESGEKKAAHTESSDKKPRKRKKKD